MTRDSHVLYESELAELEASLKKIEYGLEMVKGQHNGLGSKRAEGAGVIAAHIFVARSILKAVRSLPGDRRVAR